MKFQALLASILTIVTFTALTACSTNPSKQYWLDRSGLDAFEMTEGQNGNVVLESASGTLQGHRNGPVITGQNTAGLDFQFVIRGDSATYEILGTTSQYSKADAATFERVSKLAKQP